MLQSIEKDTRVREEKMTQYDNEVSARILGICISPALIWDGQFQEVRIKIEDSIGIFSKTLMTAQLTHLHVNSYFLSTVYFGCGVMELRETQDKYLRRTCKKILQESQG